MEMSFDSGFLILNMHSHSHKVISFVPNIRAIYVQLFGRIAVSEHFWEWITIKERYYMLVSIGAIAGCDRVEWKAIGDLVRTELIFPIGYMVKFDTAFCDLIHYQSLVGFFENRWVTGHPSFHL